MSRFLSIVSEKKTIIETQIKIIRSLHNFHSKLYNFRIAFIRNLLGHLLTRCAFPILSTPQHAVLSAHAYTLRRFFADSLPILGRFFTDSLPILFRFYADSLLNFCWFFTDSLPILCRFFADSLLIIYQFFADSLSIFCRFFYDYLPIPCKFLANFFPILCWFFTDSCLIEWKRREYFGFT